MTLNLNLRLFVIICRPYIKVKGYLSVEMGLANHWNNMVLFYSEAFYMSREGL